MQKAIVWCIKLCIYIPSIYTNVLWEDEHKSRMQPNERCILNKTVFLTGKDTQEWSIYNII